MKKVCFILILLLNAGANFAQANEITLKGIYYGHNLFIINPSLADSFAISKILVNNQKTHDELRTNAIEVDFSLMNIQQGTKVEVKIIYNGDNQPYVLNPEDLEPPNDFSFSNLNLKKNTLIWRITGKSGNTPFEVEQFRWGKWIKLGEVDVLDTIQAGLYAFDLVPHSGWNTFRVKKIDNRGNIVYSKEQKIRFTDPPEVFITTTKITNEIAFTAETLYQIYDAQGNFIREGKDRYIDVSALPRGKYWINYDNKTELISKK